MPIKYALRTLLKTPDSAIACLPWRSASANTAIFTVVNGVLLRPLPYPEPARLVTLKSNQSVPELADIQAQSQSFESIGGVSLQAADYAGGGEPVQLDLGLVSGDFFRTLGARTALGRMISAEDDRLGGERVLVLSHGLWQRQFAGDTSVLGKTITLAGQSYTVIGVTSPEFQAPRGNLDAFAPIHVFYPLAAKSRGAHLLRVYGRLRLGVTLAAAQNELRVIDQRLAETYPDENKQRQSTLLSLHERMVGDIRPALLVLFGAVGLLLLVACANFANLLLVRVETRKQELTIRSALGARRGRLIRQLLVESVLLSLLGGAAGLLLGSWGVDALLALKPADLPRVESIALDRPVLCFTLALSLVTGVVFGILPAWQATRVDVNGMVPSATRSVTPARSSLRSLLVVAELSLALVLLIGAGLLGKACWRLTSVAPGFDPNNLLSMRVELPEARYREIARQTQFREQVLENMNNLPGVQAAMISEIPMGGNAINHNFVIDGHAPVTTGDEPELYNRSVAGDYFQVLGIPLLHGRALTRADHAEAPLVGVINESMVRQYFREENPLGARIRWARNEGVSWITIVGVVGNVRHFGLAANEEPAIYTPYAQSGQAWKRWSEIVVRTNSRPDRLAVTAQLKQMLWKVDPTLPVTQVRSMTEIMARSLAERSFNALLLGVFAGVALLLATVGLYGVMAFTVDSARARSAFAWRWGRKLAMSCDWFCGKVWRSHSRYRGGCLRVTRQHAHPAGVLYGVTPTDVSTFGALAALLSAVALAACFVPARRAMKVDPMVALRYE